MSGDGLALDDGETEAEGEMLLEAELDGLTDAEMLLDGLIEAEGEMDAEGERLALADDEGEIEAEGLREALGDNDAEGETPAAASLISMAVAAQPSAGTVACTVCAPVPVEVFEYSPVV